MIIPGTDYIAILGPTGSGKTQAALALAATYPIEIISVDYYENTYTDYDYVPSGDNWESDTGIDSVFSEFEDGCGGGLQEGYSYIQMLFGLYIRYTIWSP